MLNRIFEHKREEIEEAKHHEPLREVRARAEEAEPPRAFKAALVGDQGKHPALIAEVKQASPSKGVIRPNLDPVEVAEAYERAGAQALSVLTDERFFQGSKSNLVRARRATRLPVLRKDFICDPYQIHQARSWGADAVLLIVAALQQGQIEDFRGLAADYGMDTLVEVRDEREAERALDAGCDLVGINNRNLADFTCDVATTEWIAPILAPYALVVSESALESKADIERVVAAGATAVLIGTAFCAAPDVEAKVKEVMGW